MLIAIAGQVTWHTCLFFGYYIQLQLFNGPRSGSVVECLTGDLGAAAGG